MLLNLNADKAYDIFISEYYKYYNQAFPEITKLVKSKTLLNPWITKGILKSSKIKQRLYIKFLKKKTLRNESNYKNYKRLFESTIKRSKKNYYSDKLKKHSNDPQSTWRIIKEVIGKNNPERNSFPKLLKFKDNNVIKKEWLKRLMNFLLILVRL